MRECTFAHRLADLKPIPDGFERVRYDMPYKGTVTVLCRAYLDKELREAKGDRSALPVWARNISRDYVKRDWEPIYEYE